MTAKTTKAEAEQRVNQIYKLILVGTSRRAILQYASENWGKISDRSVDSYIATARKLMIADLHDDRGLALAQEICTRKHLYTKAYQAKQWRTCLNILDSSAKLQGLFMPLDQAIEVVISYGFEVVEPS